MLIKSKGLEIKIRRFWLILLAADLPNKLFRFETYTSLQALSVLVVSLGLMCMYLIAGMLLKSARLYFHIGKMQVVFLMTSNSSVN